MAGQRPQRPRVIFASAGVGAGHNQAAKALLAGLHAADPTIEAEWVDVLTVANPMFRFYYAGGYALLVSHMAWGYRLGYRVTDRQCGPRRSVAERRRLWTERWAIRRFAAWVRSRTPALVVSTHFLSPPLIGRMIADGVDRLRQMVVVTDHDLHRFWCAENVDRYFTSDAGAFDRLADFGVAADAMEAAGIPVHPKWTAPMDEAAARAAWKLPAGRPTVVLSGGVDFTLGGVEKLADDLGRRTPEARILVLAGANKKLLARLAAHPRARGADPALRPVGFTDRVHELVRLADLVVTKPGGMTTSECLAAGAAMVLLRPAPGQEVANARWLFERGAAVEGFTVDRAAAAVERLLAAPAELESLRTNARKLATPATETIVRRILEAVERF